MIGNHRRIIKFYQFTCVFSAFSSHGKLGIIRHKRPIPIQNDVINDVVGIIYIRLNFPRCHSVNHFLWLTFNLIKDRAFTLKEITNKYLSKNTEIYYINCQKSEASKLKVDIFLTFYCSFYKYHIQRKIRHFFDKSFRYKPVVD